MNILSAPSPCQSSKVLEALLPRGVATAELSGLGDPALLLAGERLRLGHAAPERVREFAAGRLCARSAVARLGMADISIGARDDRRPHWPDALTGSITHTQGFSAAAVGERRRFRAIGIDAERLGSVSRDLWCQIFLPPELDWLESVPVSNQTNIATLLFSAKEAFYKCQYEVTQQWLEFRDIALDFFGGDHDGNSFAVRPVGHVKLFEQAAGPVIVRFAFTREIVVTAMTLAAH